MTSGIDPANVGLVQKSTSASASASASRPAISLVIITLNEEDNIQRCIRSVPWADDIVVLDSGSTDKTVELAKACGARVFVEAWRGYRDQKARATELAIYDWVLSLDADEALSVEASREVETFFESGLFSAETELVVKGSDGAVDGGGEAGVNAGVDKGTDEGEDVEAVGGLIDGLEFPRISYHMERWIRHGGWYPDWQLRFFHRGRAKWSEGHVHERVQALRKRRMKNPILHWPFKDLAEQIRTNNNYSSLGARDLFERGRRFSIVSLLLKPVSKFLETYLIKRGFMDGLPGFIISVGAAYSVFLKFAKLKELEQKRNQAKQQ